VLACAVIVPLVVLTAELVVRRVMSKRFPSGKSWLTIPTTISAEPFTLGLAKETYSIGSEVALTTMRVFKFGVPEKLRRTYAALGGTAIGVPAVTTAPLPEMYDNEASKNAYPAPPFAVVELQVIEPPVGTGRNCVAENETLDPGAPVVGTM
jgi:hypothetical protein